MAGVKVGSAVRTVAHLWNEYYPVWFFAQFKDADVDSDCWTATKPIRVNVGGLDASSGAH
jgi:hypothetical protein